MEIKSSKISEVYFGNNLDYMSKFKDNFFDIAIDDPPYGLMAERGTNRASVKQFKNENVGSWDFGIPNKEYFLELKRISKFQIIWGGNYFLEYLGKTKGFIVWDKLNPGRNFADCEFAWSSIDCVARIYKEKRVQELNKLEGGKIHPTQKPIHLYHWLLENSLPRLKKSGLINSDVLNVFDGHLGSGSHRIACDILGHNFFSCENKENFYLGQEARFKEYKEKTALFSDKKESVIYTSSDLFKDDMEYNFDF